LNVQNENVRNGKNIKIRYSTWRKLALMKLHLGVRSYSDAIEFLINKYYESVRVEV